MDRREELEVAGQLLSETGKSGSRPRNRRKASVVRGSEAGDEEGQGGGDQTDGNPQEASGNYSVC